jgi:hypothetical protein
MGYRVSMPPTDRRALVPDQTVGDIAEPRQGPRHAADERCRSEVARTKRLEGLASRHHRVQSSTCGVTAADERQPRSR